MSVKRKVTVPDGSGKAASIRTLRGLSPQTVGIRLSAAGCREGSAELAFPAYGCSPATGVLPRPEGGSEELLQAAGAVADRFGWDAHPVQHREEQVRHRRAVRVADVPA